MTRVINIKSGEPFDIYIGRFHRSKYGFFPRSKWANDYKLPKDATDEQRAEAIAWYRDDHLPAHPGLLGAVPELHGKTMGCWCAPLPCHGDVLVELAEA